MSVSSSNNNNSNGGKKSKNKGGNKQQQQPAAPPREWTAEMQADYERILSVGEECISASELKGLITAKGRGSDHELGFNLYDGFEPSGRMHIAQVSLAASCKAFISAFSFQAKKLYLESIQDKSAVFSLLLISHPFQLHTLMYIYSIAINCNQLIAHQSIAHVMCHGMCN